MSEAERGDAPEGGPGAGRRSYLVVPVDPRSLGGSRALREGRLPAPPPPTPDPADVPPPPSCFSLTRATPLRLLPAAADGGCEYAILPTGAMLTPGEFRRLRAEFGAWVLTDEPERVRRVLGLDADAHDADDAVRTGW